MNGDRPLELTGIHHVGLPCADLKRALAFYVGVLGLKHIAAPKAFADGVRWLRAGDQHIHLIRHTQTPDIKSPGHVALHVKDVRAAKAHLLSLGLELDAQPFVSGAERFYVRDPDGNSVELIQWFKDWGDGECQD